MNQDLFARPPVFIQNEKSTFVQFLDAEAGITVSEEHLLMVSDVDEMPRVLRSFYMGQMSRSVLDEPGADLLILDSYADMNFQLWENVGTGCKFWIHPRYLRDKSAFEETHRNIGYRSLEESVDDATRFIEVVRRKNPGIPVLFLNQQVDFYPKLSHRAADYAQLGARVAERLPDVYFGGVEAREALDLADVGSCGPGNTLHFQGPTYRRMWDRALETGLQNAIERRLLQNASPADIRESIAPGYGELTYTKSPGRDITITEVIDLDLQVGSGTCTSPCASVPDAVASGLRQYFYFDGKSEGDAPRFTPMLVDLEEFEDFAGWERHIRKFSGGERLRQKKKAKDRGYFSHEFPFKLHIPDVYEINNSMEERSGGPIRENLKRSIDDMGGAPAEYIENSPPSCMRHWRKTFGAFLEEPGHTQGQVMVDERLTAYISIQRHGEFAIYRQIVGHGAHLPNGALVLLHHDLVEYLYNSELGRSSGLRYIMYGGVQNGGPGLFHFKRRGGFKPYIVNVPPAGGSIRIP